MRHTGEYVSLSYSAPPKREGRRLLLTLGAVAIAEDAILSHFPGRRTGILRGFWEALESDTLLTPVEDTRLRISQKYNVLAVNPNEQVISEVKKVRFSEDDPGVYTEPLVSWDAPRLSQLEQVLAELPDSFRAPRTLANGVSVPLAIALMDSPLIDTST